MLITFGMVNGWSDEGWSLIHDQWDLNIRNANFVPHIWIICVIKGRHLKKKMTTTTTSKKYYNRICSQMRHGSNCLHTLPMHTIVVFVYCILSYHSCNKNGHSSVLGQWSPPIKYRKHLKYLHTCANRLLFQRLKTASSNSIVCASDE